MIEFLLKVLYCTTNGGSNDVATTCLAAGLNTLILEIMRVYQFLADC